MAYERCLAPQMNASPADSVLRRLVRSHTQNDAQGPDVIPQRSQTGIPHQLRLRRWVPTHVTTAAATTNVPAREICATANPTENDH